jgi:signal transduction histidine kinase
MPIGNDVFLIYVGAVLAVAVIVVTLGIALVIYQRRFLALHREYAKKLIAAHEEERAYVAREVHDDALQRVALLSHDVGEFLDDHTATHSQAQADAVRQELKDLGTMLRRVAHRLHPAVIDQGGLLPALAQLAEDTKRMSSLDATTRLPTVSESILERDRSLILYRVAQEALRNIAKHSGATRAEIAVELKGNSLVMSVADNGRGFDAADPDRSSGLGIISMTERARLADGSFALFSKPGQGTTIRVTVPLRK